MKFKLNSNYKPSGDQPQAIEKLVKGFDKNKQQTLLGVTGSGKTFTMANVIQTLQQPTLVLSHNKTLAAQLYSEFTNYFPDNKVCYFVSYYDYYQPESYMPKTDTYIEKDSAINETIEQLRLETAASLMTRKDVIVVSSVSCIYGFGSPKTFADSAFELEKGQIIAKKDLLKKLVELQYERNDIQLKYGKFRVKGSVIDIVQGFSSVIHRIELWGDKIERITERHLVSGKKLDEMEKIIIFPAKPFMIPEENIEQALGNIYEELQESLPKLEPFMAHRLSQRTNYDLEMIRELGYCNGIENYSRHFEQRQPGQPPYCLLDFFKFINQDDWLMFIDESHVTLPQTRAMAAGDRARKENLIDHGFRLPSAFDNRPLVFEEFEKYFKKVVYVSATPAEYEMTNSGQIVEQIIRPTGLVDPTIEIRPSNNQVEELKIEAQKVIEKGNRVLVTTLTKRMAEDLTEFLKNQGLRVHYLHSEIDTLERIEIIKNLRVGTFDILVGINLLREGLDIPEVGLVVILDADQEGFLRNATSLIQTIGRAARNSESKVIMFADTNTKSIKQAVKETSRRRKIQLAYNKVHGIIPKTIKKKIFADMVSEKPLELPKELPGYSLEEQLDFLEQQMQIAAENLNFEKAIMFREKINELKK